MRNEHGEVTAEGITLMIVLAAVVIVGIAVGGYLGGWWLKEDATNRNTGIANESVARQSALQDELIKLNEEIADIDVQIGYADQDQAQRLTAQKEAMQERFCTAFGKFNQTMELPNGVSIRAQETCN